MSAGRVWMRPVLAGILVTAAGLAWPADASAGFKTGVEFATGYRVDSQSFDISIGPTGVAGPNIVSELTWKNSQVYEFSARAHAENDYGVYAKGMLSYGWIVHGKNQGLRL